MVKIAHFISTSGLYGAERWILGLLNNIKKIDTLLICSSTDDQTLLKEAKKNGINTRILQVRGNYCIPHHVNRLKKILQEEKIDILHTHGYKADLIGLLAARFAKIKIISTPHGWSQNAGWKITLYEAFDRHILRFFNLVVPHTIAFQQTLRHVKRITYINNFVDLKTLIKPKPGKSILITYIGQLIERKRVQDIILAPKYLKNKNINLQIIGDGPQKKALIELTNKLGMEKQVRFLGFRKDRLRLLNKSSIVILPSTLEWIPRTMMESMAMEKMIIGTDIPGIRPLIINKETGLLVPQKSPKKIAAAIEYILNNPKETDKMRKRAKHLIEEKFSATRAAKAFEELYQRLI